jgi:hypothetical protein
MHEVVGIFHDGPSAARAADAVKAALAPGHEPRVADERDEVLGLKAEMREELDHTIAGPGNVGPFTKEMQAGVVVGVPACTLIGALVCLPLGFIPLLSIGLVPRLVIAAIVGAVAGATVGFMLGGFTAKGPGTPLAAERGVTVAIDVRTPEEIERVQEAMRAHDPIRVDLIADGQPVTAMTTEEQELRRRS